MQNKFAQTTTRLYVLFAVAAFSPVVAEDFRSHPPQRPLAVAVERPMSPGRGLYVDPRLGDDANDGWREAPWRTIRRAAGVLEPGDVLYLRGGVYNEQVTIKARGTSDKPITIRSFPGQLGVIDGGLVGVRGRLTVSGQAVAAASKVASAPASFLVPEDQIPTRRPHGGKPISIVEGYPAFDAPLIRFALTRRGIPFENLQRTWLDPADYGSYAAVVFVGDLARAKIEPNRYSADDLPLVKRYLEQGGKIVMSRGNTALFATGAGRKFLTQLTGPISGGGKDVLEMLQPDHPWLKHLDRRQPPAWINARHMNPIRASKGNVILGSRTGTASLFSAPVGKGELIYFGWDVASSMPHGRSISTVGQETSYEQQMQVLSNVIESIATTSSP